MSNRIFIGETHVVPYPFVRETYTAFDGEGEYQDPSWRPGAQADLDYGGNAVWAADAMGEMILQVVGRFKPDGYPERTFFVRLWRDPQGKEFGKNKLRVTTTAAFTRLCKGYRYPYEMSGLEKEAA